MKHFLKWTAPGRRAYQVECVPSYRSSRPYASGPVFKHGPVRPLGGPQPAPISTAGLQENHLQEQREREAETEVVCRQRLMTWWPNFNKMLYSSIKMIEIGEGLKAYVDSTMYNAIGVNYWQYNKGVREINNWSKQCDWQKTVIHRKTEIHRYPVDYKWSHVGWTTHLTHDRWL